MQGPIHPAGISGSTPQSAKGVKRRYEKYFGEKGEKMKAKIQVASLMMALALFSGVNALAKDSRTMTLKRAVSLNGKQLAPGQYKVSWETHSPEATVTFAQKSNVVATAEAKLVERPDRFDADAIVYSNNPDGTSSIVEIRFGGTNKVLTFGESSPTS
jgi:hypothetical protein